MNVCSIHIPIIRSPQVKMALNSQKTPTDNIKIIHELEEEEEEEEQGQ